MYKKDIFLVKKHYSSLSDVLRESTKLDCDHKHVFRLFEIQEGKNLTTFRRITMEKVVKNIFILI